MKSKKELAARILKTSKSKIRFADDALEDIGKAITRSDIRGLIAVGKITKANTNLHSRARARKNAEQKKKGRRKNRGSRKGMKFSTLTRKDRWISRIRVLRVFLKELKEKGLITAQNYQMLYKKAKGGFFRNKRHLKLYLSEYNLFEKKEEQKENNEDKKKKPKNKN